MNLPTHERFWSRVDRSGGPDACWPWIGRVDKDGYGMFSIGRTPVRAHRLSYEFENGPIPPGMIACHRCDTPGCVNHAHIFIGTTQDNVNDRQRKGRSARGERSGVRLHPECLHRGDSHWTRIHPEKVARGLRSGAHTHPERRARGERHWSKTRPESIPRGERHWANVSPEKRIRGERNGLAKLTEDQVREIRSLRMAGERVMGIADRFGVSENCVRSIVKFTTWSHVV